MLKNLIQWLIKQINQAVSVLLVQIYLSTCQCERISNAPILYSVLNRKDSHEFMQCCLAMVYCVCCCCCCCCCYDVADFNSINVAMSPSVLRAPLVTVGRPAGWHSADTAGLFAYTDWLVGWYVCSTGRRCNQRQHRSGGSRTSRQCVCGGGWCRWVFCSPGLQLHASTRVHVSFYQSTTVTTISGDRPFAGSWKFIYLSIYLI